MIKKKGMNGIPKECMTSNCCTSTFNHQDSTQEQLDRTTSMQELLAEDKHFNPQLSTIIPFNAIGT